MPTQDRASTDASYDTPTKRPDDGVPAEGDIGLTQPTEVKGLDSDFKQWSTKLGISCSIELNGITPTTVEERTEPRMYQLFTVWFSAILNVAGIATGALGPQVFGLGFINCCIIIVVADLISCLVPGYM
ncbi:hypothetical protein E1B28_005053 [Marasmius oreades]|uniref:Uncharacterized protein n=1 Tax=Marasmius oreades TaxID=181124 RepID=A0A9P7UZX4_9AGAR|nr:uncharacterized protein E1B28_005053 [Marasmius oreades]KAG7097733.1 hypothetical protein E1B28_005053 [Marasmius oreades]